MLNKLLSLLKKGSKDERERRILLTALATFLAKAVNALALFISVPMTLGYLGTERYGMMMSIVSTISVLGFADLGLGFGLQNRIAYYEAESDIEGLIKAVSGTFFVLLIFAILLITIFLSVKELISWSSFFNVKDSLAIQESSSSVLVFFICFIVSLPFSIVQKVQDGYQEGYFNQLWTAGGNIVGLFVLAISVKFNLGVPLLILALYGTNTVFLIFNFLFQFLIKRRHLFPSIRSVNIYMLKPLIKDGAKYFLLQFLAVFNSASDNILIAQYISPSAVAIYSIGQRLVTLLTMPAQITMPSMLSAFNHAFALNDNAWIKKTMQRNLKMILWTSSALGLLMLLGGNTIIRLWIGRVDFLDIFLLIAFTACIFNLNFTYYYSMFGLTTRFLSFKFKVFPVAIIVSFILKLILIKPFGIVGILWASVIGYTTLFFIPFYLKMRKDFL